MYCYRDNQQTNLLPWLPQKNGWKCQTYNLAEINHFQRSGVTPGHSGSQYVQWWSNTANWFRGGRIPKKTRQRATGQPQPHGQPSVHWPRRGTSCLMPLKPSHRVCSLPSFCSIREAQGKWRKGVKKRQIGRQTNIWSARVCWLDMILLLGSHTI